MPNVDEDAHAVLLPAFAGLSLSDECKSFLDRGGVSILLGESREEYVAREMSEERRKSEGAEDFHALLTDAKSRSGILIVAVDQEIGGICRLHDLAPQLPDIETVLKLSLDEFQDAARELARAATGLGVNCFLAPILDVVTGQNPWLKGRTYSTDPEEIARLSAAYIRAVQDAGVAATAKHFPGFHNILRDPAIDANAMVTEPRETYAQNFIPFRKAIEAEVEMVMVGPAISSAIDPDLAALRSPKVVDILTSDLGFQGVVMADDLDSKATMRDDSLEQVAIDALNAGCDFLLLADIDTQLSDIASAIASAASSGCISRDALAISANKVRALAGTYATDV